LSQTQSAVGTHHFLAENRDQTQNTRVCQRAVSLLQDLEAAVNQISSDTPSATSEHRLSVFAVDPRTCVAEPGKDDWFILNQMMKSAFGWSETEMAVVIPQLLNRGENGLDGFIRFMMFFVHERGLQGALFETEVKVLLTELKDRYPTASTQAFPQASSSAVETDYPSTVDGKQVHKPKRWPCEGILVTFPEGRNHHTSYPFGIHSKRDVPWNYRSIGDKFYLQAKACQKWPSLEGGVCINCQKLTSSTLYTGIMDRIRVGAHENIPLMYHGTGALMTIVRRKTEQIEQLRMSKLNDDRKLLVKAKTLEDQKQRGPLRTHEDDKSGHRSGGDKDRPQNIATYEGRGG